MENQNDFDERSGQQKKPPEEYFFGENEAEEPDNGGKRIHNAVKMLLIVLVSALGGAAIMGLVLFKEFGGELQTAEKYSVFLEAAQTVEERFVGEYDHQELSDNAVAGLVAGLEDRWSHYVTAEDVQEYQNDLNNSYVGIGVSVTKEEGEGMLVASVEETGGAFAAGISAGDIITTVNGTGVLDMTLSDAKKLVVGEAGTTVTLTILKTDGTTVNVDVERRQIEEHPVIYELIGSVGYIHLDNFNTGVADSFKAAVNDLVAQGAQSLVFDVRFNGGGLLNEMTSILDFLLPEGRIFYSVDNTGDEYQVDSDESCIEMPMAVLVNDSSYSAAEFFAACLQEYDWATVVGQHTTGKGYSQSTIYLSDGSALVLSTRKYYTPDDTNLAEAGGLAPDIAIDISDEEYQEVYLGTLAHENDTQLQAALEAVTK